MPSRLGIFPKRSRGNDVHRPTNLRQHLPLYDEDPRPSKRLNGANDSQNPTRVNGAVDFRNPLSMDTARSANGASRVTGLIHQEDKIQNGLTKDVKDIVYQSRMIRKA
ncbi:hypothetical protein PtA15_4A311 [Puccinia triticina]|uniref:Uncharacterized protein n=1 Tax=Puccinia triticina TaxID=208348 RepID=A0ABY7CM48_9BASI|nr:uncharacterized protein PtA15_4A311 [Puccinia triticina]WAQ83862.1 hypothetical protein PtA15_4A311 [Puccinia triticina]WAR54707.1 hypothetical protein PtB15_4B324 [Puccinia triticina]